MDQFNTPILIIIFNRPDKVRTLIKALAPVKPSRIFVSADGPRKGNAHDKINCAAARDALSEINWPCTVETNFSETNLGVHPGVEKAINWYFTKVEQGIILEDDCVPHEDFFPFAQNLLQRYETNERIMMISGDNFHEGKTFGDASYYFSVYPKIWGWATWKRAWQKYDTSLSAFPEFRKNNTIATIRTRKKEQRYWMRYFENLYSGKLIAWDAKWVFAIWNNHGICIDPNTNLVKNIGFGADASNTIGSDDRLSIHHGKLESLSHPKEIETSEAADRNFFEKVIYNSFFKKIQYKLLQLRERAKKTFGR